MTETDFVEFIQFTTRMLYLFVSFLCGIILGYIVGSRNGGDGF